MTSPPDPPDALPADESEAAAEPAANPGALAALAKGLAGPAPVRKRPKPGERRIQILHTLAAMLEQPGAERITTAALAARLDVSEAALYRHFASKAQMFEGLTDFIENSVFTLANQIGEREGDALVHENERLLARMNQFFDRVESTLRQHLRAAAETEGSSTPTVDANAQASAITAFAVGRLQRFARSGFRRSPTEHLDAALQLLTA